MSPWLNLSNSFIFVPKHWLISTLNLVLVLTSISETLWASLVAQMVKRLPTMRETQVWSLGQEDPLEKEMATHSSTLAWKIPWLEEHGRLQPMGSQRVRPDWTTSLSTSLSLVFISLFFPDKYGDLGKVFDLPWAVSFLNCQVGIIIQSLKYCCENQIREKIRRVVKYYQNEDIY